MQLRFAVSFVNSILKGRVVIPLIFPKVPQSLLGILRVPQLPGFLKPFILDEPAWLSSGWVLPFGKVL